MADLSNIPKQSLFQSTLKSPINSTQTTGVILNDVLSYTPGGETLYLSLLDTNNPEVISFTGQNASGELTGVTRGIALADGGSSSASAHGAGITVVLSNPYNLYEDIQTAINTKVNTGGDTITGLIDFSGSGRIQVPVFADSTARDAAIPSPVNGLMVYSTADGEFQAYQSGAWASVSSGSTQPNATETVAGKVELATQSEANTGTATGGTGASLVVTPDKLAIINQNNPYTYNTTGGSSNAYTLDLTPNVGSLSAGQIFLIKANHTNTGASTLDVDGIGATAIYKAKGEDIEAGNIQADELYLVAYDGTQFQLLNPNLTPSRGDIVIGKGAGDVSVLAVGENGQSVVYDDGEAINLKADWQNQLLQLDYDGLNVSGTASRTNLFTYTVPANMLRGKLIDIEIYCDDFDIGSSDGFYIYLTYGSTGMVTYIRPISSSVTNRKILLNCKVIGDTSNNQKGVFEYREGSTTPIVTIEEAFRVGTATEDSTTDLDLKIDVQFSDATGSNLDVEYIIVKLIG